MNNQAVILAGGLGTRLRKIVSDRPKPLAAVRSRPFLDLLIDELRGQGVARFVICVGYMGEQIRERFGDGSRFGAEIRYSEDRQAGTAGALANALPQIDSELVFVLNGDSFCRVGLTALRAWHRARRAAGTIVVTRGSSEGRFGAVRFAGGWRVAEFSEKPKEGAWVNAGVYLLEHHLIELIPSEPPVSLELDCFPSWSGLFGFPGGEFVDIGTPESLHEAAAFFEQRPAEASATRAVLLDRDGTINVERHYLSDPDGVELLPGSSKGLARMKKLGLQIVVATNQSAVGRGYFDLAQMEAINKRLSELLAADGVTLDGVYICPHRPEDECGCRKPRTGLALKAQADLGFEPSSSFVIGDKASDLEFGRSVGALMLLVTTGYGKEVFESGSVAPDFVVDDLEEAAEVIRGVMLSGPRPVAVEGNRP